MAILSGDRTQFDLIYLTMNNYANKFISLPLCRIFTKKNSIRLPVGFHYLGNYSSWCNIAFATNNLVKRIIFSLLYISMYRGYNEFPELSKSLLSTEELSRRDERLKSCNVKLKNKKTKEYSTNSFREIILCLLI